MDGSEWTNEKKLSKMRRKKTISFIALHFLFFAPSSPPFRLWLYVSYMRHFTGFISRYEYYFVRLACLPSSFVSWFLFIFSSLVRILSAKCDVDLHQVRRWKPVLFTFLRFSTLPWEKSLYNFVYGLLWSGWLKCLVIGSLLKYVNR